MKILVLVLSFCFVFAATKEDNSPLWPKDLTLESKQKITLFQPQVMSMDGDKISARTAFKIKEKEKDIYGSFLIDARTFVSKDQGVVSIEEVKISDLQLPQGASKTSELQKEIQSLFKNQKFQVPYQTLVKNRDMQVVSKDRPQLQNKPPKFVFTKRPSILIMISGDPVWAPQKGASEVERITNTSALIMRDQKKGYYLWALGQWFASKELMGPYAVTKDISSKFVMIKDDLVKEKKVDPLEGKSPDGKPLYAAGESPLIILSTVPAELLQSSGEPQFQAVDGTSLLYMSNSPNSIFLNSKTQEYFVLVTGRWFASDSLDGPWSYVSGKELPADFKKIPVTSPVAEVLVSVPGTPQAREGVIVSSIPQMAKVKKDLKPKNIECDGKIQWQDIKGLTLSYATNCNTPLIKATDSQFYAIQDGVWFFSNDNKTWNVAAVVPADIYKIPTSCPIYYVTYVHIYNVSEEYVTFGYTPGYSGTFVSADGTVVYGTGYAYSGYASGSTWYPPPSTYGYGAGYGWGYDSGFFMGFTMGAVMYPWGWGGCCWGGSYVNIDIDNYYTNWGRHTVISGPGGGGINVNKIGDTKFYRGQGGSNIYATHDGQVYRRDGQGDWKRNVGPGTWTPVEKNNVPNLEHSHQARMDGDRQFQNMQNREAQVPNSSLRGGGGMRAGGFRGGGGGFRR